jgi:hypothetical protein
MQDRQQSGMGCSIVGEKGVKYGLQLPAAGIAKKPGVGRGRGLLAGRGAAQGAAGVARPNAFSQDDDSDEDESVGAQVARHAEKKRASVKVSPNHIAQLTGRSQRERWLQGTRYHI